MTHIDLDDFKRDPRIADEPAKHGVVAIVNRDTNEVVLRICGPQPPPPEYMTETRK